MNNNTKGNNKSIINYIIYGLVIVIVILMIVILINNKESSEKEITPTPTPIPSLLTLTLNGDKEVTIIKGQPYEDPGCVAYDSKDGDLTDKIIVESNVDTNIVSSYIIKYSVTNTDDITKEETRTINVIDDLNIEIDYSPKEITNKDIEITLKISGDCLDYIQDPKGNIIRKKELKYQVVTNDEYSFLVKRTDGVTIEKKIKIENIDKKNPTGSCKNTVTNNKTTVEVNANDDNNIKKYIYIYNNKKDESKNNNYTINSVVNNVSVTIYDEAGNFETITCTKIDDTWPVLEKQKYESHSARHYNQNLLYNRQLRYILYYPNDLDLTKKNPMIVYLHGMGEFGGDIQNTLAQTSIFTNNMRTGKFQQKAIFVAPQCSSAKKKWIDCFDNLRGLIDELVSKYNVDTKKITMTGHSLGGEATFNFIVTYPGVLAAAAPLAPSSINKDYTKLKDLKIAVFTGTKDNLFSPNQADTTYLIEKGVNLKFYPLQDVTHTAQRALFNETNVIDWLISQSK